MLSSHACRIARRFTVAAIQVRHRPSAAMSEQKEQLSSNIAVVGGGLAGTSCAQQLASRRFNVTLYDMGRSGLGGRSSTRRLGGFQFDHGCQFIHARDPSVQHLLHILESAGAAAPWSPSLAVYDASTGARQSPLTTSAEQSSRNTLGLGAEAGFCGAHSGNPLWVGMPGISAICDKLAANERITAQQNCKVTRLEQLGGSRWRIHASQGDTAAAGSLYDGAAGVEMFEDVDAIVLADVMTILPGLPGSVDIGCIADLPIIQRASAVGKVPIYTLMAVLPGPLPGLGFDAATVVNSDAFQWISCDTSKPGRARQDGRQCWVAHTTAALGERLVADRVDRTAAAPLLWIEFKKLVTPLLQGESLPEPILVSAQRWGAAFKPRVLKERSLVDAEHRLALCGDFCSQADAEGALLSGQDCAQKLAVLLSSAS